MLTMSLVAHTVIPIFLILVLSFIFLLDYFRDGGNLLSFYILLFLLPPFSLLGSYTSYYFYSNDLLYFVVITMVLVVLATSFIETSDITNCFIIISLSLSIVLYYTSFSPYLFGRDPHIEYYHAKITLESGKWIQNAGFNPKMNSLINVVISAPIYSLITGLPLDWIFKLGFASAYAFSPLIVYRLVRSNYAEDISLYSSIFFLSTNLFITKGSISPKFIMPMIYMLLLMMMYFSRPRRWRSDLIIILFSFGIVTSHYGIPFLWFTVLVVSYLIGRFYTSYIAKNTSKTLSTIHLLFFLVILISWFQYVSSGAGFGRINRYIYTLFTNLTFFEATYQSGGYYLNLRTGLLYDILRTLFIFAIFTMGIGFLYEAYREYITDGNAKLYYLSISFNLLSLIALSVILPSYLSKGMGLARVFLFSSGVLCVLFVVGFRFYINNINKHKRTISMQSNKYISIFLAIFIIFNTYSIMELNRELGNQGYSPGFPFSYPRVIMDQGNTDEEARVFSTIHQEEDIRSAYWLTEYKGQGIVLQDNVLINMYHIPRYNVSYFNRSPDRPFDNEGGFKYILFRKYNFKYGILLPDPGSPVPAKRKIKIESSIENKVYTTGTSQILTYPNG